EPAEIETETDVAAERSARRQLALGIRRVARLLTDHPAAAGISEHHPRAVASRADEPSRVLAPIADVDVEVSAIFDLRDCDPVAFGRPTERCADAARSSIERAIEATKV